MTTERNDVLAGARSWAIEHADCLDWFRSMPADSCDLVLGSPPYGRARTYGIAFSLDGQAWVDWMVQVYREALRVCRGLVAFVLEGQTKKYRWSAVPALLMADLHRAGICLRKPPIYHRVGIPGSGGPDWLRNDYEFIVCATRGGKLPWSDNTACGHPPLWAPGGAMSHRVSNGTRVNQWGGHGKSSQQRRADGSRQPAGRPSHVLTEPLLFDDAKDPPEPARNAHGVSSTTTRPRTGTDQQGPKKRLGRGKAGDTEGSTKGSCAYRLRTGPDDGEEQSYRPPALANPGNVIRCNVGGGKMGSDVAHENEAPYPEALAELFAQSFCPPGGVIADCFSGSGTTGAVAVRWRRRFLGCDVRESQVRLTRRRLEIETPMMFVE